MKIFSTILFSGFAVVATIAAFSFTAKDSSLESLTANAGEKCVEATNSDCKSPSTGQIYLGYKRVTIGSVIEEDTAP